METIAYYYSFIHKNFEFLLTSFFVDNISSSPISSSIPFLNIIQYIHSIILLELGPFAWVRKVCKKGLIPEDCEIGENYVKWGLC